MPWSFSIVASQSKQYVVILQDDPLHVFFKHQCQVISLKDGVLIGTPVFLIAEKKDARPDDNDYGDTQIGRRLSNRPDPFSREPRPWRVTLIHRLAFNRNVLLHSF